MNAAEKLEVVERVTNIRDSLKAGFMDSAKHLCNQFITDIQDGTLGTVENPDYVKGEAGEGDIAID